jgi:hypothetical protein
MREIGKMILKMVFYLFIYFFFFLRLWDINIC